MVGIIWLCIPKTVYIPQYIGHVVTVCLVKVTEFKGSTTEWDVGSWGPVLVRQKVGILKHTNFHSIFTLVCNTLERPKKVNGFTYILNGDKDVLSY